MKSLITSFFFILTLSSCATNSALTFLYAGNNELHPVIFKAFEMNNVEPIYIDINKQEYRSKTIYQNNYGARIKYNVTVKVLNNNIMVKLTNIQQFSLKKRDWIDEARVSFFNETELTESILNDIKTILSSQRSYDEAKNDVYNNFLFHFLILKKLSTTDSNVWVANHMRGRKYQLKLTINAIKKNTTNILPEKKYIVEFFTAARLHNNDLVAFSYFTNKKYQMQRNKHLLISGTLVNSIDIRQTLLSASHVYLVDDE